MNLYTLNKNQAGHFAGMALKAILTTAGFGSFATAYGVVALGSMLLWASPAGAEELPFKGRIEGNFVTTPTSNPALMLGEAHAIGLATHLGAFTKVTSDVVNILTGEVTGAFTMTTASGDQLKGEYSGLFAFGAMPGTLSWLLNATITGGTGRFLHATGEFVFVAEVDYLLVNGGVHGQYTETFDGTISY
jgi:hypothetical protein